MRARTWLLPALPGRLARAPQVLEVVLVAQRVHRLPEAAMLVGAQLALAREALQRRRFPAGGVTLDVVDDRGLEHEEAAVDPAAVAHRLFLEAGHLGAVHAERAEASRGL